MKDIKLIFLLSITTLVAWSCSNSSFPTSADLSPTGPYAKAIEVAPADSLIDLAQQIPGFGGLFINDSDQLSIYLTKPTQQQQKAREVLSNSELISKMLKNLRARGQKYQSVSISNMEVLKGQYSFITLYNWKKEVNREVLSMDAVYTTGIDQSRNKLSVGVKNETAAAKVIKKLAELDIPEKAVMMYQMTPPVLY